jgi:benzoate-CoA ligase
MVNPDLKTDAITYFYHYTRARAAFVPSANRATFEQAAADAPLLDTLFVVGSESFATALSEADPVTEPFPSHRDDAAAWLFSGGTTGKPKAVVQTHRSFLNTTELYGKNTLHFASDDITLSAPKLFFGYATGTNLLFPFSVGASCALFPERCTAERLFEAIETFRPTVLINVPTMIRNMLNHESAGARDLSSLRIATSAGEALPVELHQRWNDQWGVDLLDGLGTAEMWHIFISNRPGDVRPGTLGTVVDGFQIKVCDDEGAELPDGDAGWLWVTGDSRAIGYWQEMEKTRWGFRGDWYVTGDMVSRAADGTVTYCGRADDMLKVSGKWLAIREVEECLARHDEVREAAVVGVVDSDGLTKPHAFIVCTHGTGSPALCEALQAFVRAELEPYKYPREITFLEAMPRTHLGKIDRGKLRRSQ